MVDLDRFADQLAEIVAHGGAQAPRSICDACVVALPVSGASITIMASADRQEPLYATDAVAARLDDLQFGLGEGPCVDAFVDQRPVLVPDLAGTSDNRWPMFLHGARETSASAVFVFPLHVGTIAVGVLDLYHVHPGLLDADALAGALLCADALLWTLLGLRSGDEPDGNGWAKETDPHGWLRGAPLARTEVYQAIGMIIAQLDVDAETALARLRARAFATGRPIDQVARDVVERRLRFNEENK